MSTWRVLSKRFDRVDSEGGYCILVVERDGRQREAVVSGHTWEGAKEGDEVELQEEERRGG